MQSALYHDTAKIYASTRAEIAETHQTGINANDVTNALNDALKFIIILNGQRDNIHFTF